MIDQNIFYDEFQSKINSLEHALAVLEDNLTDKESVNELFRALHTIKGTADLLGMFDVVAVVHKSEDLLDLVREGKIYFNHKLVNLYKELQSYLNLCISNTANGIYDDPAAQNLAIFFEKEFSKQIQIDQEDEGVCSFASKTILVIDDTSIERYKVKKVALEHGHSTFMCDNGIDAVKKIKDNDIDLILCSVEKNCSDAKEFLLRLHSDLMYNHIPVVLIIEYLTEDVISFAKEIGAKAWLKKPIENTKLTTILNKLLVE